ncbi:hypothetical protein NEFER03_1010 [Nematocida sp. LUAm3]|nr:hypothetical protein NEFER03_1010 [Nematocida sp. LUAm3]KAI5175386.1 hypothetical protein NEFER02_1315 [Nematocida sp. LUAm2]KAI5177657.1 hypothetical protein NEFER01_0881 [Nematocida sp. LUAm1]
MPIQGGELNYNKNDEKKPNEKKPEDNSTASKAKEALDKTKEKTSEAVDKTKEKASEALGKSDDKKDVSQKAETLLSNKASSTGQANSSSNNASSSNAPNKPAGASGAAPSLNSSEKPKAPNTGPGAGMGATGGATGGSTGAPVGTKPNTLPPKTTGVAPPEKNVPASTIKNTTDSSKPPSKPITAGAPKPGQPASANRLSNSSTQPNAGAARNIDEDSEPNVIVRWYRKIKNGILSFCCGTQDSIRHVA